MEIINWEAKSNDAVIRLKYHPISAMRKISKPPYNKTAFRKVVRIYKEKSNCTKK